MQFKFFHSNQIIFKIAIIMENNLSRNLVGIFEDVSEKSSGKRATGKATLRIPFLLEITEDELFINICFFSILPICVICP